MDQVQELPLPPELQLHVYQFMYNEEGVDTDNERKVWVDEAGQPHREDGPAVVWNSGRQAWYRHGQLHREPDKGPAMTFPAGSPVQSVWYWHGKIHRDGQPAVVMADGRGFWYQLGKLHRPVEEGPALTLANGSQWFFQHGKLLHFIHQNVGQRLDNFPWRQKVFHYLLHHDHDPVEVDMTIEYIPTEWDKTFFQPMSLRDLLNFISPVKTAGFTNLAQAAFMEFMRRFIEKLCTASSYFVSDDVLVDISERAYEQYARLYDLF